MTTVEIIPFAPVHLVDAGRLLASRQQADNQRFPALSSKFAHIDEATRLVETELNKPRSVGFLAHASGEVLGYMIGQELFDNVRGRVGWVHPAGHAVIDPDLYVDLYTALAKSWVRHGCFDHFVMASAEDRPALDVWFSLSFGMEQAHAIMSLGDLSLPLQVLNGLRVRRAAAGDAATLADLSSVIACYQAESPTFGAILPEDLLNIREGYTGLVTDLDYIVWLAEKDDIVVGFQAYSPLTEETLMQPAGAINLVVAATIPAARRLGVGRALTATGLHHAKEVGYTACITDWRTTNPLSSRFWPRIGFEPTTYRLVRRIDPRIPWAHCS